MTIAIMLGLLIAPFPILTGICLIIFLVAVFPANVHAAFARTGLGSHGMGPWYLLIRGPLQLLLIGWTWWFAVRSPAP